MNKQPKKIGAIAWKMLDTETKDKLASSLRDTNFNNSTSFRAKWKITPLHSFCLVKGYSFMLNLFLMNKI